VSASLLRSLSTLTTARLRRKLEQPYGTKMLGVYIGMDEYIKANLNEKLEQLLSPSIFPAYSVFISYLETVLLRRPFI
jgi:hypothetical protein